MKFHIAIDGIDGSGKTTQSQMLKKVLDTKGYNVFYTKFIPRASKVLLELSFAINQKEGCVRNTFNLSHLEYVYACDEYLNYFEVIKPKLDEGFMVIQDRSKVTRYVNAQIASSPKFDIDTILDNVPDPDITIILSIAPEIAFERLNLRGNRTEDEDFSSLEIAAKFYHASNFLFPNTFCLDAAKDSNSIHNEILSLISKFYI